MSARPQNEIKSLNAPSDYSLFAGGQLGWRRYWCPYPGSIDCDHAGAFLNDPEEDAWIKTNAHLRPTLALVASSGPLVLCGEPGLGKTTESRHILAQCLESNAPDDEIINVDFREVGDFADFRLQTFGTDGWKRWADGVGRMTLIVDAVDEGLLQIHNFVERLTGELRRQPTERLRLILTCRTAEWPATAQGPLFGLWSLDPQECQIFELGPLRQVDARIAAASSGVDPAAFIRAIYDAQVAPLAARPVTLSFLLKEYRSTGNFGKTHRDLYENGARWLCNEPDPRRSELLRRLRKSASISTLDERLEAARDLAARLLLGGISSIEVTNDLNSATLDAVESGLFTSVGANKFAFVHRTIAECLASQKLATLPLLQLRRLLCRRDNGQEHVVPQLAELAAWVAGSHLQFLEHLLRIEPAALLRSDIGRIQGTHKAALFDALLTGAEREEIFDEREYTRFYRGLNHAELPPQLRPYLTDKTKGLIARRLAFEIAEACRRGELIGDFFAVLRDATEPQHIREMASDALCESMPVARLSELIPLAQGQIGADPQNSIRGDALKKLVPNVWPVRDALRSIEAPSDYSFVGSYEMVLQYHLPEHIQSEDVAPVLDAMCGWEGCLDSISSRHALAEMAFCLGLERLNEPEIAENMVRLWTTKTRNYHSLSSGKDSKIRKCLEVDHVRRKFAECVLNSDQTVADDIHNLLSRERGLIHEADVEWLLTGLTTAPTDRLPLWLSATQSAVWYWLPTSCWDLFIARRAEIPALASMFPLFSEIDTPLSRLAKAHYLRRRRQERRWQNREEPIDVEGGITECLTSFREGKTGVWASLIYYLSLNPGAHPGYHNPLTKVEEMPGWQAATDERREEFRAVARSFLTNETDGYAKFGARSTYSDPGFLAIDLLKAEVSTDAELRTAIGADWIGAVTGWFSDDDAGGKEIFGIAYSINPEATVRGLLREASEDRDGHGHLFAFRRAEACWDQKLSGAASAFILECTKAESVESGLQELAHLDLLAAEECAWQFVERDEMASTKESRDRLSRVISTVLAEGMMSLWERSMTLLSRDNDFARETLLSAAGDIDREGRRSFTHLNETQIGDFYLLLCRLFPPEEDPAGANGTVTPRQSVTYLRGNLLTALTERASEEACAQFLRFAAQRPSEATWHRWRYRQTLQAKRRGGWSPLPRESIDRLLDDPRSRWIDNEEDLAELVMESLERLQVDLTGRSNPAVEDLWNHEGNGNQRTNFRPKDEEHISGYVARWLERDIRDAGLVINREVQPRRGSRLDILVEAVLPASYERQAYETATISVTIEVKGCWNPSVKTAVESQLVEQYLRPHGRTHGIYLVAWFDCLKWQGSPPRRGNTFGCDSIEVAREETEKLCLPYAVGDREFFVKGFVLDARLDG